MEDLVSNPPEGIKVQINDEDVTDIQAYIDGPAGGWWPLDWPTLMTCFRNALYGRRF